MRKKPRKQPNEAAAAIPGWRRLRSSSDRTHCTTLRIGSLGVQLKDFERGLVDFPSLRDGRVVLLCWQLGEGDELEWWHDVDAGFAGRTPL